MTDPIDSSHHIVNIDNLSEEERKRLEVIEELLEPCDRKTYGQRLEEASKKLNCSRRTIQRLVSRWEKEGIDAVLRTSRADKGKPHIDEDWLAFITKTYKEGNKGSRRLSRAQVYLRVKAKAEELGTKAPGRMTVYRILQPYIEDANKSTPRNPGWRGDKVSLKAKEGVELTAEYSNHVWQCDHTKADILLVDSHGNQLGRPWLTIIVDSYSRCVVGFNIGYDAPSSKVVALALRHAILPKNYASSYRLKKEWGTYGKPNYLFTDSGKDFKSNHAQQISVQLGISWHFRSRPSEGGIVERVFNTINTQFFSTLPGYTGSNIQERPKEAEKDACITLAELEKLIVRYLVDTYNQSIDARMADQTRYQRWDSGLIYTPDPIGERELDICLMKSTRRTIYQGGYLKFENLTYRSELLSEYAGDSVIVRYDPMDITSLYVYQRVGADETFMATAHAQDLEAESLSLADAKSSAKQLRNKGKTLSNRSILSETQDREIFLKEKKTRKQRQQEEQEALLPKKTQQQSSDIQEDTQEEDKFEDKPVTPKHKPRIIDYQDLMDNYYQGF